MSFCTVCEQVINVCNNKCVALRNITVTFPDEFVCYYVKPGSKVSQVGLRPPGNARLIRPQVRTDY